MNVNKSMIANNFASIPMGIIFAPAEADTILTILIIKIALLKAPSHW